MTQSSCRKEIGKKIQKKCHGNRLQSNLCIHYIHPWVPSLFCTLMYVDIKIEELRTQTHVHWTRSHKHQTVTTINTTHITASVSPYPSPAAVAVSWSCGFVSTRHVSWISGQWLVSTIGRNNRDPESINRDTTNTHWPLDITIIHSLAILRQIG